MKYPVVKAGRFTVATAPISVLIAEVGRMVGRLTPEQLVEYYEEQRALFRSKGQDPNRASREAIVPTGETLPNGIEVCRIISRGSEITPVIKDDEAEKECLLKSIAPSRQLGMAKSEKRGKYRDGGLLIEQAALSVDRSEYRGF